MAPHKKKWQEVASRKKLVGNGHDTGQQMAIL